MVQIQGSVDDLQFLSKIYTEEPAKIQLLCGDYFLSGCFLNGLVETMDVIERAKGQLELMLGAARIESGSDSLFASLSGILYQKSADGIIPKRLSLLTATMSIGSRIRISIGEYGDSRAYMKAAERDEHLNFAVRLWADSSRTWPRLY